MGLWPFVLWLRSREKIMVIIMDMKLPKSCFDCEFFMGGGFCLANKRFILAGTRMDKERSYLCPLRECK